MGEGEGVTSVGEMEALSEEVAELQEEGEGEEGRVEGGGEGEREGSDVSDNEGPRYMINFS